jgi:tetratricopeptide (TPR) repeat protein
MKTGSLLHISEDFDGAIAEFTKAIEVNPSGFDAHINRGVAHQDKGAWQLAIDDFEKERELAPNDYAGWNNIARLRATSPDDSIRHGQQAVDFARGACKRAGYGDWSAVSTLAAANAEFGDFHAAICFQEMAIRAAPAGEGFIAA